MKKLNHILLMLILTLAFTVTVNAQDPPPPPGDHGLNGNQDAGGGAPIGGGLFVLLGLGAAYGGKKIYERKKEGLEE